MLSGKELQDKIDEVINDSGFVVTQRRVNNVKSIVERKVRELSSVVVLPDGTTQRKDMDWKNEPIDSGTWGVCVYSSEALGGRYVVGFPRDMMNSIYAQLDEMSQPILVEALSWSDDDKQDREVIGDFLKRMYSILSFARAYESVVYGGVLM